jgi:hypothetical protein
MEVIETGGRNLSEAAPIVAESAATKRQPGPKRRLKCLADLDRRTAAAKAAYALQGEIIADLGGPNALSAMQRVLIDHVATLAAALGDIAAKYLAGEDTDMVRYATLANSQRRLLADLGLERRAIDVQQHLSTYLAAKRGQPSNDIQQDDGPEEMDPAP